MILTNDSIISRTTKITKLSLREKLRNSHHCHSSLSRLIAFTLGNTNILTFKVKEKLYNKEVEEDYCQSRIKIQVHMIFENDTSRPHPPKTEINVTVLFDQEKFRNCCPVQA